MIMMLYFMSIINYFALDVEVELELKLRGHMETGV